MQVDRSEAEQWAAQQGLVHLETSALTNYNVEEAFLTLTKLMIDRRIATAGDTATASNSVVNKDQMGGNPSKIKFKCVIL